MSSVQAYNPTDFKNYRATSIQGGGGFSAAPEAARSDVGGGYDRTCHSIHPDYPECIALLCYFCRGVPAPTPPSCLGDLTFPSHHTTPLTSVL